MSVAVSKFPALAGGLIALPLISWPGGSPENTGIIIGVIVGAYVMALWLTAIIWTARDVRSRSHDPVTQLVAVLMVAVLNLPGWVLYRVLRPPLTLAELYERQLEEETLLRDLGHELACPTCSAPVDEDYVACPHCATGLKESCEECGKALSFAWRACPWCAHDRSGVARRPAVAAVAAVPGGATGPEAGGPVGLESQDATSRRRSIEAVESTARVEALAPAGDGPFGKPRTPVAPSWKPPAPSEGPRRVDSASG